MGGLLMREGWLARGHKDRPVSDPEPFLMGTR